MKQIVCEQPDQLVMREAPEPQLDEGLVIVRVRRIGICGTDLHAYKGNQPFFSYPRVLGHELAGEVEAVHPSVDGVRTGDIVSVIPYMECGRCIACRGGRTNCCTNMQVLGVHRDGGMSERMAVPASHLIVANQLTLDQAAVLEPLSIGAHAVRRSELQAGDTALVIGAGPIGLGVMALAKQRGAKVIAMDVNEERLAYCRTWAGVEETVHALHSPKERLEAITGGDYPLVVFDATGNAQSMMQAIHYVAHSGKLVYVGLVKGDITFSDPEFHKRELTMMGSRNATREDFELVVQAVESGRIDVDSFITHRADFDGMIEAYDGWLQPEAKVIKAVVEL